MCNQRQMIDLWPADLSTASALVTIFQILWIIVMNTSWVTELQDKCSAKVFYIDVGLKLIS